MTKYRKKPIVVEAEQWQPEKSIEGVKTRECEIHYSLDGKLYYITKGDLPSTNWLSVEAFLGPVPEEKQHGHAFSEGWVQFSPKGEETYHRKRLPFSLFEVESGESKPFPAEHNDKLFLDYGCVEKWTSDALKPPQQGWIETPEGTMTVSPGDWIIRGVKGELYRCKPDVFDETYELCE